MQPRIVGRRESFVVVVPLAAIAVSAIWVSHHPLGRLRTASPKIVTFSSHERTKVRTDRMLSRDVR